MQETVVKRDERILAKQAKITACLSAVGKAFSDIVANKDEKLSTLELLSDVSRILADLQHGESTIRKSLILTNLNASLKNVLSATTADEWLFGKQLEEKLKSAKALENSRRELKPTPKAQTSKPAKNSKPPPRRPLNNQKQYPSTFGGRKEREHGFTTHRRDNKHETRKQERNYRRKY